MLPLHVWLGLKAFTLLRLLAGLMAMRHAPLSGVPPLLKGGVGLGRCRRSHCFALPYLQAQLEALEEQHIVDLSDTSEAAAKHVAAQAKTADQLVRELQAILAASQGQLMQETERADVAAATLNG